MKLAFTFLTFLFILSLTVFVNAQDNFKSLTEEPAVIQNYQGNGDVTNTSTVPVQRNDKLINSVRELSRQLNQARENDNSELVEQLEDQINALVGTKESVPGFGPQAVPLSESIIQRDGNSAIGINVITAGAMWGTATTTQNTNGRIWVATTHYAGGVTDTLRIFYSDDDGDTWTYFNGFTYNQSGVDFLANDIDIEVLNDGTNWWIYVTGGYSFNSSLWGFVTRFKDDGTGFFYENLAKNSNTNQYWTRIVSDYPRFTSIAYVYIVATMDSAIDANNKAIYSRAFTIEDPYASSPTVLNRNNNVNGSSYWWYAPSAPNTSTARSDVAYYDSLAQGDRIVTSAIFEFPGVQSNIYMTYSDNYMATIPYLSNSFSLTYNSSTPIMSFSGGNDQLNGCISHIRFYQDTLDADPRYVATTDGGGDWGQGYIDASFDETVKADVIGLRGIDGHFKFGYINDLSPNDAFYYRTGYLNGSLTLTPAVMMSGSGIFPDDVYGGRAGYRIANTDSCFAVYEGPTGVTAYGVTGCSGAVSVDNSEVLPNEYLLTQNYPNPFNPSTTIKYSIPETAFVNIKVYNLIGQEIAELVNEEMQTGNHEVTFDAVNMPSGVYFYRIQAGSFVETRKMMLMK